MRLTFFVKRQPKRLAKKYDVKTSFIRNGSGSTFAKVEAEKNNPQADVWFGGTFDPQAQAAELGLIEPYKSKHIDKLLNVSVIQRKPKDLCIRYLHGYLRFWCEYRAFSKIRY